MGRRDRWIGYEKLLPVLPCRTDMSPPGRQGEKWSEHDLPYWKSTCHEQNLNLPLYSWQNQTFRRRWVASSPSQRDWLLEEAWSCLHFGQVERWAGYLFLCLILGNCVTQLKLYTLYELSSPIFCCLWVSESGIGVTRPNLHFFQYIQAYKPYTDSVPTNRVTHSILGLVCAT